MFFKQFKVEGLGCLSYLIGCQAEGRCIVVDPKRDVIDYIQTAQENGMNIDMIIDTHTHADHISGSLELQSKTGAAIFAGNDPDIKFPHNILKEGDTFKIGSLMLEVINTPGHTPYAVSILIKDITNGNIPQMLLTGDILFVGSIGRPDLAGKEILEEQINNIYNSLHNKIGLLPDFVEIYPAHGEGSLCGAGISSKLSSTIGYEKAANPYYSLSYKDLKMTLLKNIPYRPENFTHIISTNKSGPTLIDNLPMLKEIYADDVKNFIKSGGIIIDLRDAASFGGAHIEGSINIGLSSNFVNWIGTVVDPKKEIVLLVNRVEDINSIVKYFLMLGYDNILGYLNGINDWIMSGNNTGYLPQISVHSLYHIINKYQNHQIIDVRSNEEWESGHIKGSTHIPLQQLIKEEISMPKDTHISIVCRSGYRSNIAASLLKSKGFKNIYSVIGGMHAWLSNRDFLNKIER